MSSYVLSAAAEADLREIIRYTRRRWGDAQVRKYVLQLEAGIECLAKGDGTFRDLSGIHPSLRMAKCQHHYVFCLPRDQGPALIIAILHERMDFLVRLAGRL